MADTKIHDLTELTTPVAADEVAIVDDTTGTPVTKKISLDTIDDYLKATTKTLTNKTLTSPVITTPTVQNYDGWQDANETWTYSSVDDPTGILTVPSDATTKYSVGMRIKFTNGGSTIYGIIIVVTSTTITFLHQIDPTDNLALVLMADSAITAPYYSTQKAPLGFPLDPLKWSVTYKQNTTGEQTTPTSLTWYNLGGSLSVPIGGWILSYRGAIRSQVSDGTSSNVYSTLSTANNSESDVDFSTYNLSGGLIIALTIFSQKILILSSKAVYYFNIMTATASTTVHVRAQGAQGEIIITAICAYL